MDGLRWCGHPSRGHADPVDLPARRTSRIMAWPNARLAAHRYLLPLLRVDTYAPVQLLRREVHGAGHGLDACSMKWFAAGSTILGQIPGIAANLLPERLKRLEREGAAGGPALLRSAAAV